MKKTKKVLSFLLLSAFLMANIPLSGVHAADNEGTNVFPDSEITIDLGVDVLKTQVVLYGESEVYQVYLEFENRQGYKVVVSHEREGSTFTGERPIDSFIVGGDYMLTRVFGRMGTSANYSFTADELGKEIRFSINKENVLTTKETVVELSSNEMYDGELLSITIDLPFEPYSVKEIKGIWKFLDKQEGDGDYYAIMFMNNWGMKYNKELGLYEADLWISGRPEGRYELESIEIESWSGDENIFICSSDANAKFNADYTFKGFEGVDMGRIKIKDITAPVKYGDTVTLEVDAGEGNELVESVVVKYWGTKYHQYTLEKDVDGKFRTDIYINRYMMGGEHRISSIEVYGKDGVRLGYETAGTELKFKSGTINVADTFNVEEIEMKVTAGKSVYSMGADVDFELAHNLTELDYLDMHGTIQLNNLDFKGKDDLDAYAMYHWDSEKKVFIIDEVYGFDPVNEYYWEILTPGRYVVTGINLGSSFNYAVVTTDSEVLFTVANPLDLKPEEIAEKEDALDYVNYILDLIDNSSEEESKALVEKYMGIIMPIVIESKAVEADVSVDKPKYVFNSVNLRALHIEEALDANVGEVNVRLDSEVLSNEELVKYSAQLGEAKDVIALYNLALMKIITTNTEEVTTSKIENKDIKGLLTLRLPVPEEFKDSTNLKVIHITAEGVVEELETKIVVEGENTYLEFQTNHFSIYGIIEDNTEVVVEEPVVEEPVVEEPVVEEPVVEEPVVEEPVVDSEVIEAEVGEEVVVVAEEGTEEESEEAEKTVAEENEKLVKTGASSTLGYSLSGILILGAGLVLLKKEEGMTVRAKR